MTSQNLGVVDEFEIWVHGNKKDPINYPDHLYCYTDTLENALFLRNRIVKTIDSWTTVEIVRKRTERTLV